MAKFCVHATWDDVPHLSQKQKDELWSSIPEYERDARAKGIPILGSGRVFPCDEKRIKTPAKPIPKHWVQINGVDFGIDHPFAAANLAWDRDADCVYVCKTYRQSGTTPVTHAAAIKPWGKWIPCAWPHDGLNKDKGSGEQLAKLYRDQDLSMLPERATHAEGGNGVEAGIAEMLDRMLTDRFKVFDHLNEWFEEFRMYHRKDGQIVKLNDDLMSASRYAVMMLRKAITQPSISDRRRVNTGLAV